LDIIKDYIVLYVILKTENLIKMNRKNEEKKEAFILVEVEKVIAQLKTHDYNLTTKGYIGLILNLNEDWRLQNAKSKKNT